MSKKDPRIDAYIARSSEFARPILKHLRAVVHEAVPEVEEAMKWSFPNFQYKGMFCSMAAFKAHCAFNFWKGDLVFGGKTPASEKAMGQFGRITALSDLPPKKALVGYLKAAKKLNDEGAKPAWLLARNAARAAKAAKPAKPLAVPADLAKALKANAKAKAAFAKFPPSHRREYVQWITEAKREETRRRRLETAVSWIAAGRQRNWQYER